MSILSDPGVVQGFFPRQSLGLLDDKQLLYEVLAIFRNTLELDVVEVEGAGLDLVEDVICVCPLEGHVAANKRVEDDAERPDVCLI